MQLKMGGKFHLKLNIGERPIANKYREGKNEGANLVTGGSRIGSKGYFV